MHHSSIACRREAQAVIRELRKVYRAAIVVHAARFGVELGPPARPGAACVEVQEGLVVVHTAEAAHYLGPGRERLLGSKR